MKIIFDLDGTLFKTEVSILEAVAKISEIYKITSKSNEEIIRYIGLSTDLFLENIFEKEIIPDDIRDAFRQHEWDAVNRIGVAYEGIYKMLEELKKEHELYICSAGSMEYINLVVDKLRIREFFCGLFSAKQFQSKTEAIKTSFRELETVILIGDTETDYNAAKHCPIPFIFCAYGYGNAENLSDNNFVVKKPAEIVPIINRCKAYKKITDEITRGKRKLIGINGVDTSGKTCFTNELSIYLAQCNIKNSVMHMDDFHNMREIRYSGENEVEAYYTNAFNYNQLLTEVFIPIKEKGELHKVVSCLDLDEDKYSKNIAYDIDKDTVVLVEGVLLFRKPLISYFDMKIYIDITFEEVIRRAQYRDVPKYGIDFMEKYINKYIPIQKRYMEEYHPKDICDILINNNDFNKPEIVR